MCSSVEKSEHETSLDSLASPTTTFDAAKSLETGESGKLQGRWDRFARILVFCTGFTRLQTQKSNPYPTLTRTLDTDPVGYAQIATFQSSDQGFMQYRSFGYLHARILSDLQYQIEQKEKLLNRLDEWDKSPDGNERKLRCKGQDEVEGSPESIRGDFALYFDQTRPQVLTELRPLLREYDEFLLTTKEVASLQRPSKKDYTSVRGWIADNGKLVEGEDSFIQRKEDIVTLRTGRESVAFDDLVERALIGLDTFLRRYFRCRVIQAIFLTPELVAKTADRRLSYFAPAKVNTLVNVIITLVIFVLMIIPVVAMYELTNLGQGASPFEAMGILIIFTLLFGSAMSSLTKATRQELFGASAAYCAVLVVFISNFSTQTVTIAQ